MRNFKYLIFIIISLFSVPAFAYTTVADGNVYCKSLNGPSAYYYRNGSFPDGKPLFACAPGGQQFTVGSCPAGETMVNGVCKPATKCPSSGYPIPIYFNANTPVPLKTCNKNPDGTYCITQWTGDPNKPVVISGNNYQSITHASVSEIPSPSCTPEFSKSSCDPNDPYGGCYKPPNDGCNRMSDGSIYCPPDEPAPPIQSGCSNNATYCDMPPTGCGSSYVPGTFNGKQICVKNGNPPPTDPISQPPSASEPPPVDPNNPPPASSPPPDIPPESNSILRSILDAVNAVNNKLTWVKNELVNAISNVAKKIDGTNAKLDAVNAKLDIVNTSIKDTTAAVNTNGDKIKSAVDANANTVKMAVDANTAATKDVKTAVDANTTSTSNKLNEVVNAINNKPAGTGGTTNIDLTETNGYLKDIKEFLGAADSSPAEDGKLNIVQQEIDTNFNGSLFKVSGTCPPPMQISFNLLQSYTIQFSYETFCYGATLARPWVIFIGMLTAFFIVTGHYRGANND